MTPYQGTITLTLWLVVGREGAVPHLALNGYVPINRLRKRQSFVVNVCSVTRSIGSGQKEILMAQRNPGGYFLVRR